MQSDDDAIELPPGGVPASLDWLLFPGMASVQRSNERRALLRNKIIEAGEDPDHILPFSRIDRWSILALVREVIDLRRRLADVERRSVQYRGTWKQSIEYHPGDCVTHAGSAWHCSQTTRDDRPGTSAAWVLMVKKGRDFEKRREQMNIHEAVH